MSIFIKLVLRNVNIFLLLNDSFNYYKKSP